MTWDNSFEAHPVGDDFGSVSTLSMRQLLAEFYTRLSKEHTITEGVAPQVVHTPGVPSVVGLLDGTPLTRGVVGALQYSRSLAKLFIDSSSVMSAVGGINHSVFTLNVLDVAAHTQYILFQSVQDLTGVITTPYVNNLDVVEADYTGYAGGFTGLILPRGLHKGVAVAGGNKHYDGIISDQSIVRLGYDKMKVTQSNVLNTTLAPNASAVVTLNEFSFIPYFDPTSDDMPFQLRPAFIDNAASFPGGTITPQITVVNPGGIGNRHVILNVNTVSAA